MSRMADSRRDISVMKAITATTPSEVIHQMDEISHRTPLGGEPSVVAMVCSSSELVLVPSQHTSQRQGRQSEPDGVRAAPTGLTVTDRGEDDGPPAPALDATRSA